MGVAKKETQVKTCSVEWDGAKCGIEMTEVKGFWYCQKCDLIQDMTK